MSDAPDTASPLTATLVQTLFPMTSKAVLKQRLPTLLAAMQEFLVICARHFFVIEEVLKGHAPDVDGDRQL